MKTEQQYLEECAATFGSKSYKEYKAALLALQKQREDIKKELKEKIESIKNDQIRFGRYGVRFDRYGDGIHYGIDKALEILNTL